MADGKVLIEIDGDTKDFEKSLSGLGGIAQKALGAVTTAVAGIGTAFAVAGAKSLGIASNLQEVQNVVDVTFGEGAKQIEAFANTAGEAFGLSELQAKKYTSTLGAMYKSMGLGERETLEMSQMLAGLTGDIASFYNLDHETAFQKIQSGISGEIEPLRQLGINLSVANLEAYAMAEGLETAFADMSEAEKATLRYNYILQQTADAQGDFARTSEGFANQLRITGMQAETLGNTFGNYLLPIATEALGGVQEAIKTLGTELESPQIAGAIETIGEGFATAFESITDFVVSAIPELLQGFATLIEYIDLVGLGVAGLAGAFVVMKAQAGITALLTAYSQLGGVIGIATKAQVAFNAVMSANPIGLIVGAVGALVGALIYLYNTNDKVKIGLQLAWEYIKLAIYKSIDTIIGAFDKMIGAFNTALSYVGMDTFGEIGGLGSTKETEANIERLKNEYAELGNSAENAKEEIEKLKEVSETSQDNDAIIALQKQLEEALNKAKELENEIKNINNKDNEYIYYEYGFVGPTLPEEDDAEAKEKGKSIAENMSEGISGNSSIIGDSISDTVKNALNGQYETFGEFGRDLGKNLIQSLGSAITDTTNEILSGAIKMSIKSIIGAFTGGFGIASPSKVFAEMGMWNMQGLANGMTDNVGYVDKSLGKVQSLVSGFSPSFDYSALQAQASAMPNMAMAGGASYGLNVNVTNINNAPNTEVQTTQTMDSQGNLNIENFIISTIENNIFNQGQIPQALSAVSNKTQMR